MLTPAQRAVEAAVRAALGDDVANTNNMQELFTDVKAAMVVGPDHRQDGAGRLLLVLSLAHVPRSQDRRHQRWTTTRSAGASEVWLKPNPGTTATLLNGIARADHRQGPWPRAAPDVTGYQQLAGTIQHVSVCARSAEDRSRGEPRSRRRRSSGPRVAPASQATRTATRLR